MYWLVEHPISQYEQDVKALAKDAGLRIIDAKYKDSVDASLVAEKTPSINKKGEKKTRKPRKKAKE